MPVQPTSSPILVSQQLQQQLPPDDVLEFAFFIWFGKNVQVQLPVGDGESRTILERLVAACLARSQGELDLSLEDLLLLFGEQLLLQEDAELLAHGFELLQVLLVLALVLDLGLDACVCAATLVQVLRGPRIELIHCMGEPTLEDTDGGGVVVHPAGGF